MARQKESRNSKSRKKNSSERKNNKSRKNNNKSENKNDSKSESDCDRMSRLKYEVTNEFGFDLGSDTDFLSYYYN